ncbi:MAG: hypothetical protein ACYDDF_06975 [Thermoplasmatota archaeon]
MASMKNAWFPLLGAAIVALALSTVATAQIPASNAALELRTPAGPFVLDANHTLELPLTVLYTTNTPNLDGGVQIHLAAVRAPGWAIVSLDPSSVFLADNSLEAGISHTDVGTAMVHVIAQDNATGIGQIVLRGWSEYQGLQPETVAEITVPVQVQTPVAAPPAAPCTATHSASSGTSSNGSTTLKSETIGLSAVGSAPILEGGAIAGIGIGVGIAIARRRVSS